MIEVKGIYSIATQRNVHPMLLTDTHEYVDELSLC